ncbi:MULTISPECIES: GNAT family N-acetyltransferase [unclassified Schaalia]|uniref:GNAT family N-acetyltransferase n=1 Tax=unclassified Schaalia TaxID=2691889 RepID=UPI001E34235B|nr:MULTISPECIES: GNAT family N-acetyltransferase [unclassified Schaalia]MCD4549488.1 GNAT family N-acetyltransferase [Schaalia sp. lx-260]MCD4558049.1 GNAT family N-acetyltransferase [Schaalia sp. lx-100]
MKGLADRINAPVSVPYPGAHLGLRWRPLIASDAPGIYDLCVRTEAIDQAIYRTSAMEIADMLEGPRGRDVIDTIVGLDPDRKIAAFASVRVMRDVQESAMANIEAVVDPQWRGRGIGRSLLYWQDGRARQMLVDTFGADCTRPASIVNFVDSHMTDRRRLCIAAGFSAKRSFQVMYRELEGSEEAPHISSEYTLRKWDQVDRRIVRGAHMEVFLDHYGTPLRGRWWNEAMSTVDDRWSSVLTDKSGEIVAYCLVGRPAESWVATGRPEAYVELLGVRREHRGHHLATQLLNVAIASAARTGVSRIGLDVDTKSANHAHEMYERLGFVDDRAEVLYSIDC